MKHRDTAAEIVAGKTKKTLVNPKNESAEKERCDLQSDSEGKIRGFLDELAVQAQKH